MATIDSKDIIVELLRNDGVYDGDPQASSIWKYTNQFNKETQAVYWNEDGFRSLRESPYVSNPILLWDKNGLTEAGRKFLEENGDSDEN